MKIAVISDVHANEVALRAALDSIWARGADEVWCLGDTVGLGPCPDACVSLVREHCQLILAGNHDASVAAYASRRYFTGATAEAAEWAELMLSAENFAWLRSLHASAQRCHIACYHGSIRDPLWEFVSSVSDAKACLAMQESKLALFGHTHQPSVFRMVDDVVKNIAPRPGDEVRLDRGVMLLNPGTIGRPQSGELSKLDHGRFAMWMMVDTETERAEYHRTDYDLKQASQDYLSTGLPRALRVGLVGADHAPG
jgi:predicted phosphodiesterase